MLELIIIVLLLFIAVQEYLNRKERKGLIETIIAKNLQDLGDLETKRAFKPLADKTVDIVPVSDLTDEKFDDYIKKVNEEEQ
jgi:hypothetical protein